MRSIFSKFSLIFILFLTAAPLTAEPKEDLFKAIKWKSLTRTKQALSAGADINSRNEKGQTPIMVATEVSSYALFKFFLDEGADLEARDYEGNSPGHYVAAARSTYIVRYALKKNIGFETLNRKGETPLITSIKKARYSNMVYIIKSGVSIKTRDSEGKTPLLVAGENGYSAFVQALLNAGADINAKDRHGNNLLHLTTAKNDYKTVSLLLKKNFPLTDLNSDGQTALIIAAEKKRKYITKILLEKTTDASIRDRKGRSALHYVAEGPYYWYMKSLTEKGAKINQGDNNGKTPLLLAVESGRYSNIKALVDAGADPNLEDRDGLLPIHVSYNKRLYKTTEMLLKIKADANRPIAGGKTMLIDAIERNSITFTTLLLKNGADPNIKSPDGNTPLLLAIENNRYSLIRPLLKGGASVTAPGQSGERPLTVVVNKGYSHMLNALLENGGNVNETDSKGKSLLYIAHTILIERFNEFRSKMFTSLVRKGANVNITDEDNIPLLLVYVNRGLTFYSGLLIEHGAKLSVTDRKGNGPMHLAVKSNRYQIVSLLVKKKVPITTRGNEGNTPLHYAVKNKSAAITSLLLKGGANVNIKNNAGYTPVHLAVQLRNKPILEELIKNKADLKSINGYGNSLLMEACKLEDYQTNKATLEIIDTLIKGGAGINQKNRYGNTPLMYAINRQNATLVKYLLEKGANPDITDSRGNTHLKKTVINAVYSSLKNESLRRIIYALADHGADINKGDSNGTTPLIEACTGGLDKDTTAAEQVTQTLLDLNADTSILDSSSRDAMFYARQQNSSRLLNLLNKNMENRSSSYGFPPLELKREQLISFKNDNSGNLYLLVKKETGIELHKRGGDGGTFWRKNIKFGTDLAVTSDNFIYVLGKREGTIKGQKDKRCKEGENMIISLRKFNSQGILQWEETDGRYYACNKTSPHQVIVDNDGNAYIGITFGSPGYNYLSKYSPTGKQIFKVRRYGTWDRLFIDEKETILLFGKFTHFYTKSGGRKYSLKLSRLSDSKIFTAAGSGTNQVFFKAGKAKDGFYLERLSYRGDLMWKRYFRSGKKDIPAAITVDSEQNVYVTGTTSGSLHGQNNSGGNDIFTIKVSSEGNRLWTRIYGSSANEQAEDIRPDTGGGIFIVGSKGSSPISTSKPGENYFIIKYSSRGSQYGR